jgi:putative SOS response-associated peptidase YedK
VNVAKAMGLRSPPAHQPRYNIAPSQEALVVAVGARADERLARMMRWGLVPPWAADASIGHRLINARGETAASKPAFRAAMRSRRCLVPADGFYEWLKRGRGRMPHLFHMRDGRPFAFAGLWERWKPPGGDALESFTILTTDANELVRPVHDRMPVIVPAADYARWLDPDADAERVADVMMPFPAEAMTCRPVSTVVNSPQSEGPRCHQPPEALDVPGKGRARSRRSPSPPPSDPSQGELF